MNKRPTAELAPLLDCDVPERMPVLPLMSTIVFPLGVTSLQVRVERSKALLRDFSDPDNLIALVTSPAKREQEIRPEDLSRVGLAARVIRILNMPGGNVQVTLEGLRRIEIVEIVSLEPYMMAHVFCPTEVPGDPAEVRELVNRILKSLRALAQLDKTYPPELDNIFSMNLGDPGLFADTVASIVRFPLDTKRLIVETLDVRDRLEIVAHGIEAEIARLTVAEDVVRRTSEQMEKGQREFFLRQQLNEIRRLLGEDDPQEMLVRQILERAEGIGLPHNVLSVVEEETNRLRYLPPSSQESGVIRNYIDWLLSLPWSRRSTVPINLDEVARSLDEKHFGLEKVKERILEYLAVLKLKNDQKGPILCFAGPPGTGKTSLGASIARAMGRACIRMSVGGVRDEAEIRGHRRTYIGSRPGKIIRSLRDSNSSNPVFMIDEIDKLGHDAQGDPAAALLEVLDPEQNQHFIDHYIEIPFDLSETLFITTANVLDFIPPALLDRLEVIQIPGYMDEEKLEIARRHLIPREAQGNGLAATDIAFDDAALLKIIREYTREAGVRQLERAIDNFCRKAARQRTTGYTGNWKFGEEDVEKVLGPPYILPDRPEGRAEVGVATGLAWTTTGGDLLVIEALKMRGAGRVIVTGQLGDVMKESVQTAHSYVRARAEMLCIDPKLFDEYDMHIHFPEGAVPKDGPSAGITIVMAIASALADAPIRNDVAMTGEVTLRGKVIAVGGLKEKVMAAHRAGIKTVIFPADNQKDLVEIPETVRTNMTLVPVAVVDEVFQHAFAGVAERIAELEARENRRKERAAERAAQRAANARKATRGGSRAVRPVKDGRGSGGRRRSGREAAKPR
ncbi:MAG TPA: endopeptidase La [Candidatus Eisenbacteria bacterium]|jgi:ATP-dependent Lon protease|nr:endopeptidase La [Candidatus Eisenbacteria bacterium]